MAATEVESSGIDAASYTIRPNFQSKFRPPIIKEIIHKVLVEYLADKQYSAREVEKWSKDLSQLVKDKIKEEGLQRYKLIVQSVISEQRGMGVKMGCRCMWDMDNDNYAQDIFMNESLFCIVVVYGVYYY